MTGIQDTLVLLPLPYSSIACLFAAQQSRQARAGWLLPAVLADEIASWGHFGHSTMRVLAEKHYDPHSSTAVLYPILATVFFSPAGTRCFFSARFFFLRRAG